MVDFTSYMVVLQDKTAAQPQAPVVMSFSSSAGCGEFFYSTGTQVENIIFRRPAGNNVFHSTSHSGEFTCKSNFTAPNLTLPTVE